MKKITTFLFAVALMVTMSPVDAHAQSYYNNYSYNPQSSSELIAYLNSIIAQLQAQIQNRGGGYGPGVYFNPNQNQSTNVEVETLRVSNIDDDSASLYGEIDLNRAAFADVWFEFGQTTSMNNKSLTGRATTRTDDVFRSDVYGLADDEKYYYRAVARAANGARTYGSTKSFTTDDDNGRSSSNDDDPEVTTDRAEDIEEDEAELHGEVDMNDFNNGIVFFVYGEDENQIEDVESDYDSYSDVDEDGDDLQKVRIDTDLDGNKSYWRQVSGLDDDTEYFYQICVEYEDDDDDDVLACGGVEDFETDRDGGSNNNNDDEPEAKTDDAEDVEEDEAELHGDIDMNDFDNGVVFFVYGEDENQIEDVQDDYDSYSDVDEDGDDLQKVRADSDLDGSKSYWWNVVNLDDDTDYYYQICVEYEDEDDDDVLECGGVEEFQTDRD